MVVVSGPLYSPLLSFDRHQWTTVLNVLSFALAWGGLSRQYEAMRCARVNINNTYV